MPPLYLTVAVDRQTGLTTMSHSAQESCGLEDCRRLIGALEQVLRVLQERRVELEVVAAMAKKQEGEAEQAGAG